MHQNMYEMYKILEVHPFISSQAHELDLEVSNNNLKMKNLFLEEVIEGSQDINWIFSPSPFPAKRMSVMNKKNANMQDNTLQRIF